MEDNWDLDDDEDFTLIHYNSLKKIRIDFIEEKKHEHKYLVKWFEIVSPFYQKFREDPSFHSFFNHNELKASPNTF